MIFAMLSERRCCIYSQTRTLKSQGKGLTKRPSLPLIVVECCGNQLDPNIRIDEFKNSTHKEFTSQHRQLLFDAFIEPIPLLPLFLNGRGWDSISKPTLSTFTRLNEAPRVSTAYLHSVS